jgi:hypothetical protein
MTFHPEDFGTPKVAVPENKPEWAANVVQLQQGDLQQSDQRKLGVWRTPTPVADINNPIPDIYSATGTLPKSSAGNDLSGEPLKDKQTIQDAATYNEHPGWIHNGLGSWVKNTALPPNWDHMSDAQQRAFLDGLTRDAMDEFSLLGPGGRAKVGWHQDEDGEFFWFGYAGQEPTEPPPNARRRV